MQHLALRLEDVEAGYGLVLLVQARVIKGIYLHISLKSVRIIDNRNCKPSLPPPSTGVCFENQENYSDALDCYLGALKVAEQHPQEQNKSLSFWLEECLYRSVLLQLRKK